MVVDPVPVIEFQQVAYTYPGQLRPALDRLTLAIPRGRRVALLGRNGSGKSTVLLHCNGVLRPDHGEIRIDGQRQLYTRPRLLELRRKVGLVFQNPDDQLFSASVYQDISFGPLNLGLSHGEAAERVRLAASLCQVDHCLERPTHALSGGEKTRVALAGVLAMDPQVVIADEITTSLDPWMRLQIFEIFDALVAQGRSVVLSTHDLDLVRDWSDHCIFMQAGQALYSGAPSGLFDDPAGLRATGLDQLCRS